jgi:hypothetical protein
MAIELNKVVVPEDVYWTHSYIEDDRDELLRNRGTVPTIIHSIGIDEIPTYCMYGIYELTLRDNGRNFILDVESGDRTSWNWNIELQGDALLSFKKYRYIKFQLATNFTANNLTTIRQNFKFFITLNLGTSTFTTHKEAQVMPNSIFLGGTFVILYDTYTKEFVNKSQIYTPL